MIKIGLLTAESIEEVTTVYKPWCDRVSHYFGLDHAAMSHTLLNQPEVHPADFEMVGKASLVATEGGTPVGWVQAGYVSGIPSIPEGQRDALIRGLMVDEGRGDVARMLLDRAIQVLGCGNVRAWRAFEHNCGYTFAAGIGKAPDHMADVGKILIERGFQSEDVDRLYVAELLSSRQQKDNLGSIKVEFLPRGWAEPKANVEWDQFNLSEYGQKVGYATVIPIKRLTHQLNEESLFVKGIAVEDQHQRRGIGYLIMKTLWEHYHPQGINRIVLNTGQNNKVAQKFYESVGYRVTDRVRSYIAESIKVRA